MKNIFICTDGTWNTLTQKHKGIFSPTNVAIMSRIIVSSDEQLVYYDEGVGTGGWWDKIKGGVTGAGLNKNIKQAYCFIVDNYQDGDNIILFGFSRGAYTARSLAGLIAKTGILRKKYISNVNEVFKSYRKEHDLEQYSENYCHANSQEIFFIGVWDTVGSLGIPVKGLNLLTRQFHKFHNTELSLRVKNAYHAVAIDEKRTTFKPVFWDIKNISNKQTVEQVFFAGVHCNIGGGYAKKGLSDTTLKWMIGKAQKAITNLKLDNNYIINHIEPHYDCKLYNSKKWWYFLSHILPHTRKVDNASKHSSVCKRFNDKATKYGPKNISCS